MLGILADIDKIVGDNPGHEIRRQIVGNSSKCHVPHRFWEVMRPNNAREVHAAEHKDAKVEDEAVQG